jgi:hypothetical protein
MGHAQLQNISIRRQPRATLLFDAERLAMRKLHKKARACASSREHPWAWMMTGSGPCWRRTAYVQGLQPTARAMWPSCR